METFFDILLDTCMDCLKLLPFLLIAFLLIEALEHYSSDFTRNLLQKVGKAGPVIGALAGCVPQCGFSVLAANLFAGGLVSPGTLIAVFLSTSDEAIIIILGNPGYLKEIGALIAAKIFVAIIAGYFTDLVLARRLFEPKKEGELCENEHCGCHEDDDHDEDGEHDGHENHAGHGSHHSHGGVHHVLLPALRHTWRIAIYLFLIILALNAVMELLGQETFSKILLGDTIFQPFLAAVIGFIPNCAASVFLTQLYLNGVLSFPAVIAGLCTGAGAGLLVLLRVNRHKKENITIIALMYIYAVAAGMILFLAGMPSAF